MGGVLNNFLMASMFMWIAPIAILFASNHNLLPGTSSLSSYSMTLLSGFIAVISVNMVIAFYIFLARREASQKHEPNPAFVAAAKASMTKPASIPEDSSQSHKKEEYIRVSSQHVCVTSKLFILTGK